MDDCTERTPHIRAPASLEGAAEGWNQIRVVRPADARTQDDGQLLGPPSPLIDRDIAVAFLSEKSDSRRSVAGLASSARK
uniref:Uncharacterized protein n=1 Tax=Plectus sambesii TaxID=2011161 RepID=A0A914UW27_9BILA